MRNAAWNTTYSNVRQPKAEAEARESQLALMGFVAAEAANTNAFKPANPSGPSF